MMKASYTVEAVFVCSICIWVMLALMYASFYIHDKMILGSVTSEMTAEHFQKGEESVSEEWKSEVKKTLSVSLFLMQIQKVEAKKGLASVKVKVKYKIPISVQGMKSLFTGQKESNTYVTVKGLPKPVEYKWDADLVKRK